MKKRTLILLTVASLLACSLTACERHISSNSVDTAGLEMSNFTLPQPLIHILLAVYIRK